MRKGIDNVNESCVLAGQTLLFLGLKNVGTRGLKADLHVFSTFFICQSIFPP